MEWAAIYRKDQLKKEEEQEPRKDGPFIFKRVRQNAHGEDTLAWCFQSYLSWSTQ